MLGQGSWNGPSFGGPDIPESVGLQNAMSPNGSFEGNHRVPLKGFWVLGFLLGVILQLASVCEVEPAPEVAEAFQCPGAGCAGGHV